MHDTHLTFSGMATFVFEIVVKKRLPRQFAGLLSPPLKPMDTGTIITSRKGFLKRAGAAIAASLSLGGIAQAGSTPKQTAAATQKSTASLRIRPMKGAVARKSIEQA